MKDKIGETAGKIWNLLKEKGEVNISQLPRLLNEKSLIVQQALGWLAREDKIEYRTEAGKTRISLTETEQAR
jgi:Mn-dependent DtxR family transcriptional regulator